MTVSKTTFSVGWNLANARRQILPLAWLTNISQSQGHHLEPGHGDSLHLELRMNQSLTLTLRQTRSLNVTPAPDLI